VTTRGAARAAAAERLRLAGGPTAALDADLLLAHVCSISKEELYAHLDRPLGDAEEAAFEGAVARRAAGEPVAYIRGYKEFFGLRIAVDPCVLIPRPETEVLVEVALAWLDRTQRRRAADIGTGSGAIAIAIATNAPEMRVIATDISSAALEVARANVAAHGLQDRVDLRHGDLLGPIDGTVDLVAANLPYLRADSVERWVGERTSLFFEPREAVIAGEDGLDAIRHAIEQLPQRLASHGTALFECDPPQVEPISALLAAAIGGRIEVHNDLSGAPRVVQGTRE
jgi:release factor glutamine methyltransferase